jgi:sugar transferase (PEP-CTERM/EpsH1 system associated)
VRLKEQKEVMRILWLKTELLHPVDKGGKIRTYEMLRQLRRSHEVTYLTLTFPDDAPENSECAVEQATEYCQRLIPVPHQLRPKTGAGFYGELLGNLASPLPLTLARYRSAAMRRAIAEELRQRDYDLIVCDFLTPSVNLSVETPCPKLLFQHNVEAMIWQRHAEQQTASWADLGKRLYLREQWRKMRHYERQACHQFDAVVAVSREDADHFRQQYGVPNVYDVPTGVDVEYFRPQPASIEPHSLVFVGSMDWLPNEDGVVYFAEEILPRVAAELPGVTVKIVGRNPTPRVLELARKHLPVTVTGRVDDVRPHVAAAAACIVPLRIGGGTRLKIFEAMAMGKPVVSTAIGAEGLPVRDGAELLIADGPDQFAQSVVRLLRDDALRQQIGQNARAAVCARFGWEAATASFARICERVAQGAKANEQSVRALAARANSVSVRTKEQMS